MRLFGSRARGTARPDSDPDLLVTVPDAWLATHSRFTSKQQLFLDFVLQHYVTAGVQELAQDKLAPLLRLRYENSIADAVADLGKPEEIGQLFAGFQRYLYEPATSG